MRIAFVGAPGVGKTTLANGLQYLLKKRRHRVELIPELAKFKVYRGDDFNRPGFDVENTNEQKELEDVFSRALAQKHVDIVISEAPLCNGYFYATFYKKEGETPRLELIARDFINTYDVIFLVRKGSEHDTYEQFGRHETEDVSMHLGQHIEDLLRRLHFRGALHIVTNSATPEELAALCSLN